jgi:hypothetical protein
VNVTPQSNNHEARELQKQKDVPEVDQAKKKDLTEWEDQQTLLFDSEDPMGDEGRGSNPEEENEEKEKGGKGEDKVADVFLDIEGVTQLFDVVEMVTEDLDAENSGMSGNPGNPGTKKTSPEGGSSAEAQVAAGQAGGAKVSMTQILEERRRRDEFLDETQLLSVPALQVLGDPATPPTLSLQKFLGPASPASRAGQVLLASGETQPTQLLDAPAGGLSLESLHSPPILFPLAPEFSPISRNSVDQAATEFFESPVLPPGSHPGPTLPLFFDPQATTQLYDDSPVFPPSAGVHSSLSPHHHSVDLMGPTLVLSGDFDVHSNPSPREDFFDASRLFHVPGMDPLDGHHQLFGLGGDLGGGGGMMGLGRGGMGLMGGLELEEGDLEGGMEGMEGDLDLGPTQHFPRCNSDLESSMEVFGGRGKEKGEEGGTGGGEGEGRGKEVKDSLFSDKCPEIFGNEFAQVNIPF